MSFEIFFLSVGLALDAMWVSIGIGLAHSHKLPESHKWLRSLCLAGVFGFFQFLMIYLGSVGGEKLAFSPYGQAINLGVAVLFLGFSLKLLVESFQTKEKEEVSDLSSVMLLGLGIATSLDALLSGLSLSTYPTKILAAFVVGFITFIMCFFGHHLATRFAHLSEVWFLRLASLIFLILAIDVAKPIF